MAIQITTQTLSGMIYHLMYEFWKAHSGEKPNQVTIMIVEQFLGQGQPKLPSKLVCEGKLHHWQKSSHHGWKVVRATNSGHFPSYQLHPSGVYVTIITTSRLLAAVQSSWCWKFLRLPVSIKMWFIELLSGYNCLAFLHIFKFPTYLSFLFECGSKLSCYQSEVEVDVCKHLKDLQMATFGLYSNIKL